MDHSTANTHLPDSTSPNLHLSHPTPEESVQISTNTYTSWHDTLSLPDYLAESRYLATVPLARNDGLTTWILVDERLPPNARPILSSCESYRKRALTSDAAGNVSDAVIHGVASVFCAPAFRRRGYAARMMKELTRVLRGWQTADQQQQGVKCVVGSILYSDIGKTFYADLGWQPHPSNTHVALAPAKPPPPPPPALAAREIVEDDLAALCSEDEAMIRKAMATPAPETRRVVIVPDCDHMLWHLAKEAFSTERLFGKVPQAKGAIAGPPGRRVWVVWTHRYYAHPDAVAAAAPNEHDVGNVLYILRLVVEGFEGVNEKVASAEEEAERVDCLKAVLQAAQAEAVEWRLDRVELWDPSPAVRNMITKSGLEHTVVEREEDGIASGLWYDENGEAGPAPLWMNNEHYAWC